MAETGIEIDRQEKELARLLEWIGKADSKAQILIGAALAMIGAVLALAPEAAKKDDYPLFLIGVACFMPVVALYQCFAAAMPHVKGPKDSLIFFMPIAARCKFQTSWWKKNQIDFQTGLPVYQKHIADRTNEQYLDDLNQQCLINATIADAKFRRVKRAWYLLVIGAPIWIIIVLALYRGYSAPDKPKAIEIEPITINVAVTPTAPVKAQRTVKPKVVN